MDFAYLDSGVGGLPYLRSLLDARPKSSCVYIADVKNFPYGEKSKESVISCSTSCVKKIIDKFSPKVIVVACNTISVAALDSLRLTFPGTLFVGTVPALKLAASVTKTKIIGLLATNRTINDPYTKKLIDDFAFDCKVIPLGAAKLITFIEHQYFCATKNEKLSAIKPTMDYFLGEGCDTVVLACTHFLNMVGDFIEASGGKLSIIDSREGVTKQAIKLLNDTYPLDIKDESPSFSTPKLFVTSFHSTDGQNERASYERLSRENGVEFAGILA